MPGGAPHAPTGRCADAPMILRNGTAEPDDPVESDKTIGNRYRRPDQWFLCASWPWTRSGFRTAGLSEMSLTVTRRVRYAQKYREKGPH